MPSENLPQTFVVGRGDVTPDTEAPKKTSAVNNMRNISKSERAFYSYFDAFKFFIAYTAMIAAIRRFSITANCNTGNSG